MHQKISLKKHLLAGVSAITFATFLTQGALAATVELAADGSNFGTGAGDINNVSGVNGLVTISTSRTMTDTSAITLNGTGNITINGAITITGAGTGSAIVTNSATSGDVTINNSSGIITAAPNIDAMVVKNGDTLNLINNSGKIESIGTGAGILSAGTINSIQNSGTISSTGAGTGISATSGTISLINNFGTILTANSNGPTNGAIYVAGGTTVTQITNSGTITDSAGGNAINLAGNIGTLTNSGIIGTIIGAGTINAVNNDGNIDLVSNATNIANNLGGTISVINNANNIANSGAIGAIGNSATILNNVSGNIGIINSATDVTNTGVIGVINSATNITNNAGSILSIGGADKITNTASITGIAILNSGGEFVQTAGSVNIVSGSGGAEIVTLTGGTISGDIDMGGLGTIANDGDKINFANMSVTGKFNFDELTATSGTTTLSGIGTGFNALSKLTVNNGAILKVNENISDSGIRQINGELNIAAGKTVSGGGTVTIGSSGILRIAVTDANTYGKVTGTSFSIDTGGTIAVDTTSLTGSLKNGQRLNVYTGSAPRGTFTAGTILNDNSFIYKFTQETPLIDSGNSDVDILVSFENLLGDVGGRGRGPGMVLDDERNGSNPKLNNIISILDSLPKEKVKQSLTTLLPPPQISELARQGANIEASTQAISNQIARVLKLGEYGEKSSIATGGEIGKKGVWGQAFGSAMNQNDIGDIGGYQANLAGFILGADTAVNDKGLVGVSFAYGDTNAKATDSKVNIASYQTSLYGSYDLDKVYYEGIATFAYNNYNTSRTLFDSSIANAKFSGQQYSSKFTAGYKIYTPGALKLTPFISAQYIFTKLDPYSERGSSADLTVKTDSSSVFKTGIGAKLAYEIISDGFTYTPKLSATWFYDFLEQQSSAASNFTAVPSETFISRGASVPRNEYRLGAGLDIISQDDTTVSLDYSWTTRKHYNSHTGEVKVRSEF